MKHTTGSAHLIVPCPFPDCRYSNSIDADDQGAEVFCERCGRAFTVPEAPAPRFERRLWRFSLPKDAGTPLPVRNAPAVTPSGRLCVAIEKMVLSLHDAGDAVRVEWEYRTGGVIPGSPALHTDGSLRVHSDDGKLHGIAHDGRPLWPPVEVGKPLSHASPAVDGDGRTWICHQAGGLICVDATGQTARIPFFPSPSRFDCAGVLWNQTLIVGSEDHFVHAIDLRGRRGADLWDQGLKRGDTGWYVNAAPAMAAGPLFVVAGSLNRLHGFDPHGQSQWEVPLPGQALGAPIVDAQDRVFVGISRAQAGSRPEGSLACCDIRRREIVWECAARGPVESTPVAGDDGTVYFGDNAGWIHAVNPAGKLVWSYDASHPVRSRGALVAPGRLVFGDDTGSLLALKCESQALAGGWPMYLGGPRQTAQYAPAG